MKRTRVILAALAALPLVNSLVADAVSAADVPKDRVVVMYFHRTERCPTCRTMGSYTEEAVKEGFAKEIKAAKVAIHFIDFQDKKNAAYTKGYNVTGPTLIVAKVSGKKVVEYKNLQDMWSFVADKEAFVGYVRTNVEAYLAPSAPPKPEAKPQDAGKQDKKS
jgi:thiol-disulfide isomerase/thioredoxin